MTARVECRCTAFIEEERQQRIGRIAISCGPCIAVQTVPPSALDSNMGKAWSDDRLVARVGDSEPKSNVSRLGDDGRRNPWKSWYGGATLRPN